MGTIKIPKTVAELSKEKVQRAVNRKESVDRSNKRQGEYAAGTAYSNVSGVKPKKVNDGTFDMPVVSKLDTDPDFIVYDEGKEPDTSIIVYWDLPNLDLLMFVRIPLLPEQERDNILAQRFILSRDYKKYANYVVYDPGHDFIQVLLNHHAPNVVWDNNEVNRRTSTVRGLNDNLEGLVVRAGKSEHGMRLAIFMDLMGVVAHHLLGITDSGTLVVPGPKITKAQLPTLNTINSVGASVNMKLFSPANVENLNIMFSTNKVTKLRAVTEERQYKPKAVLSLDKLVVEVQKVKDSHKVLSSEEWKKLKPTTCSYYGRMGLVEDILRLFWLANDVRENLVNHYNENVERPMFEAYQIVLEVSQRYNSRQLTPTEAFTMMPPTVPSPAKYRYLGKCVAELVYHLSMRMIKLCERAHSICRYIDWEETKVLITNLADNEKMWAYFTRMENTVAVERHKNKIHRQLVKSSAPQKAAMKLVKTKHPKNIAALQENFHSVISAVNQKHDIEEAIMHETYDGKYGADDVKKRADQSRARDYNRLMHTIIGEAQRVADSCQRLDNEQQKTKRKRVKKEDPVLPGPYDLYTGKAKEIMDTLEAENNEIYKTRHQEMLQAKDSIIPHYEANREKYEKEYNLNNGEFRKMLETEKARATKLYNKDMKRLNRQLVANREKAHIKADVIYQAEHKANVAKCRAESMERFNARNHYKKCIVSAPCPDMTLRILKSPSTDYDTSAEDIDRVLDNAEEHYAVLMALETSLVEAYHACHDLLIKRANAIKSLIGMRMKALTMGYAWATFVKDVQKAWINSVNDKYETALRSIVPAYSRGTAKAVYIQSRNKINSAYDYLRGVMEDLIGQSVENYAVTYIAHETEIKMRPPINRYQDDFADQQNMSNNSKVLEERLQFICENSNAKYTRLQGIGLLASKYGINQWLEPLSRSKYSERSTLERDALAENKIAVANCGPEMVMDNSYFLMQTEVMEHLTKSGAYDIESTRGLFEEIAVVMGISYKTFRKPKKDEEANAQDHLKDAVGTTACGSIIRKAENEGGDGTTKVVSAEDKTDDSDKVRPGRRTHINTTVSAGKRAMNDYIKVCRGTTSRYGEILTYTVEYDYIDVASLNVRRPIMCDAYRHMSRSRESVSVTNLVFDRRHGIIAWTTGYASIGIKLHFQYDDCVSPQELREYNEHPVLNITELDDDMVGEVDWVYDEFERAYFICPGHLNRRRYHMVWVDTTGELVIEYSDKLTISDMQHAATKAVRYKFLDNIDSYKQYESGRRHLITSVKFYGGDFAMCKALGSNVRMSQWIDRERAKRTIRMDLLKGVITQQEAKYRVTILPRSVLRNDLECLDTILKLDEDITVPMTVRYNKVIYPKGVDMAAVNVSNHQEREMFKLAKISMVSIPDRIKLAEEYWKAKDVASGRSTVATETSAALYKYAEAVTVDHLTEIVAYCGSDDLKDFAERFKECADWTTGSKRPQVTLSKSQLGLIFSGDSSLKMMLGKLEDIEETLKNLSTSISNTRLPDADDTGERASSIRANFEELRNRYGQAVESREKLAKIIERQKARSVKSVSIDSVALWDPTDKDYIVFAEGWGSHKYVRKCLAPK